MIAIVDYGLGNVRAFLNVYKRLGIEARAVGCVEELRAASRIILPGVGSFDDAMRRFEASGMRGPLGELVDRGVPVLGVCVGMQILARSSDEGRLPGLGWVEAQVRHLGSRGLARKLPLPHMGWNDVRPVRESRLFGGVEAGSAFYFLHSYYVTCDREQDVLAVAAYGTEFCCAVNAGSVFGVQFHPEKSHSAGMRVLANFAEL